MLKDNKVTAADFETQKDQFLFHIQTIVEMEDITL